MKQRRLLVLALGAGLSGHAALLRAQATGLRRVGVLAPSTRAKEEVLLKPFFDQMRALGWIEGQTIAYDSVFANDQHQDLPRLAAELVARKPDLIYAPPYPAAVAARQDTRAIPIVFFAGSDPVGAGLVARPRTAGRQCDRAHQRRRFARAQAHSTVARNPARRQTGRAAGRPV